MTVGRFMTSFAWFLSIVAKILLSLSEVELAFVNEKVFELDFPRCLFYIATLTKFSYSKTACEFLTAFCLWAVIYVIPRFGAWTCLYL